MANGKGDQGGGAGARALTPQRRAVLQAVAESDEHPTAGEIFEAARKSLPSISFATVYNSLKYLTEAGLVREMNFGKGSSRYDRVTSRHDHAVCSRCGRLVDFDLPETTKLVKAAARRSRFKPESVHLTLVGVCPGCREKESGAG
jgi:Fur family peroxide stress response transcriptional regulator